jgi:hypothetical protein
MLLALLFAACGGTRRAAAPTVAGPAPLAALLLDPADLGGAYLTQSETFLDEDGRPVTQPTQRYRRILERAPGATAPADLLFLTVNRSGAEAASAFIETADDDSTGPPGLEDYIAAAIPGSRNVQAAIDPDFPGVGDASVANRLTWKEESGGQERKVYAYAVYIQQDGVLAFVAVRAAETGGGEPPDLRAQAEEIVRLQATKLKNALAPSAGGG